MGCTKRKIRSSYSSFLCMWQYYFV